MPSSNSSHHQNNPLQCHALAVHKAFEKFGKDIDAGIKGIQHQMASGVAHCAGIVHHIQQQVVSHLPTAASKPLMAFAVR